MTVRSTLLPLLALSLALAAAPAPAAARAGAGESQIDEGSPDAGPEDGGASTDLEARLRAFAVGSLARYDEVKRGSAGFRRQGWFPSCWLRDADADIVVEGGGEGGAAVTVHVSCARRDIDQQLVVGPLDRFLLPGADRRFFAELVAALAGLSPQLASARLRFWFASLEPDGRLVWVARGALAMTAEAARGVPPGSRTAEALWPLLVENTVPASLWPE